MSRTRIVFADSVGRILPAVQFRRACSDSRPQVAFPRHEFAVDSLGVARTRTQGANVSVTVNAPHQVLPALDGFPEHSAAQFPELLRKVEIVPI